MSHPQLGGLQFCFSIVLLFVPASGQFTPVVQKTEIYQDPTTQQLVGQLYPGAEIRKLGKDASGSFIRATIDFYIPINALKEARIAKGIGESQSVDSATIKLLSAKRDSKTVRFSVAITNDGTENLDMSALLLFRLTDRHGNQGKIEIVQSKNTVGTIRPGKTLRSDLLYSFDTVPEDVELSFQSRLGGNQVYFMLGF